MLAAIRRASSRALRRVDAGTLLQIVNRITLLREKNVLSGLSQLAKENERPRQEPLEVSLLALGIEPRSSVHKAAVLPLNYTSPSNPVPVPGAGLLLFA